MHICGFLRRWGPTFLSAPLAAFSVCEAVLTYPKRAYMLCASMGLMSVICLVLSLGWMAPCTILGTYVGFIISLMACNGSDQFTRIMMPGIGMLVGAAMGAYSGFLLDRRRKASI